MFQKAEDISRDGSIILEVYEKERNLFIAKEEFYFLGDISMLCRKEVVYILKVSTSGAKKLVVINIPKVVSIIEYEGLYDKNEAQRHMMDLRQLSSKISVSLKDMRKMNAMDLMNSQSI